MAIGNDNVPLLNVTSLISQLKGVQQIIDFKFGTQLQTYVQYA